MQAGGTHPYATLPLALLTRMRHDSLLEQLFVLQGLLLVTVSVTHVATPFCRVGASIPCIAYVCWQGAAARGETECRAVATSNLRQLKTL